jgi:hypothetical protein
MGTRERMAFLRVLEPMLIGVMVSDRLGSVSTVDKRNPEIPKLIANSRAFGFNVTVQAEAFHHIDGRIRWSKTPFAYMVDDLTPRRKDGQPDKRFKDRHATFLIAQEGRFQIPDSLIPVLFGNSKVVMG